MEEIYQIRWGNLYLVAFSPNGSSCWSLCSDQAVWLPLTRANQLVLVIRELDDIPSEVERV
jgi:hypothetical protein